MSYYADSSFLVAVYWFGEKGSAQAAKWMTRHHEALPFTPFHRHEVRTALRAKVARDEMTLDQCRDAFGAIDSDLKDGVLTHQPIPWTDAFREAETFAAAREENLLVRSLDLLHVGTARALKAERFITFDTRQAELAKLAGIGPVLFS